MHHRHLELWLNEITVAADGPAVGAGSGDTAFWGPAGVRILAVAHGTGQLRTKPGGAGSVSAPS